MKTSVLFLIEKDSEDEVFAYFPDDQYNEEPTLKMSYSHLGQHSACHCDYADECTKASPDQYIYLLNELEGIGYELEILN